MTHRLTEISERLGACKAVHNFTEVYGPIFDKYKSPKILEVGIAEAKSIKTYLEFFDSPTIIGMDKMSKHPNMEMDYKTDSEKNNWKFIEGDQTFPDDLMKCELKGGYDIIIDDGGHMMNQQQISFGILIDMVKKGGYYIIEDLHTSFMSGFQMYDSKFTTYEMLEKIEKKELGFSSYLTKEMQENILEKVDKIKIWSTKNKKYDKGMTAIIKLK